jgi:hypothetical protein
MAGGILMPPEVRYEKIVVETDCYRVEGEIILPQEGYRSRLSDYLNRRDQEFLTIVNVELTAIDGSGRDWNTPVLMLARRYIRLVVPTDREDQ